MLHVGTELLAGFLLVFQLQERLLAGFDFLVALGGHGLEIRRCDALQGHQLQ